MKGMHHAKQKEEDRKDEEETKEEKEDDMKEKETKEETKEKEDVTEGQPILRGCNIGECYRDVHFLHFFKIQMQ